MRDLPLRHALPLRSALATVGAHVNDPNPHPHPHPKPKPKPKPKPEPNPNPNQARILFKEGGVLRFYRGFTLKCGFVALNGAIFNTVFVGVRRVLGAYEERRAT